jgi:hypothetical protein
MYGELLELIAGDVEGGGVFTKILAGHHNDPPSYALPLRLVGGLHRLALDGRAPALQRWYPSVAGRWDSDALTVLWHSTCGNTSAPTNAPWSAAVSTRSPSAPTPARLSAHLRLEPQPRAAPYEFVVRARSWPGGADTMLAVCAPHGPPVNWE